MTWNDLKGNTLKLYLVLATQRDQQDRCCLSRRALRRLTGLARDTIDHAVFQLEHHGLLVPQKGGWQIELLPLRQLVQGGEQVPAGTESGPETGPGLTTGGPEIGPVRVESGPETGPGLTTGGPETGPVGQGSGPEIGPPAPPFNAPTRTLWSSSSEEDVLVKTSTPSSSPSPGGTGGEEEEEVPEEFLVEMSRLWKTIAPQEDEEPRDWFGTLYREFGPQIPLTVLRQFVLGDRTLSQLRHPSSYKSYFACCCRKAREESLTLPRQSPALARPLIAAADFDQDEPAPCQEAPPLSQTDFEQDWVALARAHNTAQRRRFQLEMERSP
ncbi:MAG: hypothetical protein HYW07_24965 [Candidatus Latescibacteria bacterium]|nr:hypothetical protein [Candidatus Latescibacterota bacterium]